MRTVYLQKSLSLNGRGALGGRRLVDGLRAASDDFLLGALIYEEESAVRVHSSLRDDVISESQFLAFAPTVIVIEGGLFSGREGGWKVHRSLAEDFVRRGGTLLVADVDLNVLREQRAAYGEAAGFLGASARYNGDEPNSGYDRSRNWKSDRQILCATDDMVVDEWLLPVYDGIPEVLCGLPVEFASWGEILASGNQHSTETDGYLGFSEAATLPWASVHKQGGGFVVMMSASVTHDAWLDGCRYNTPWLTNVCRFLSDEALTDRQRAQAVVRSDESLFLSHATADKPIVSDVYEALTGQRAIGAWIDAKDMLPGDTLPEHIIEGIRRATAFVVFWSSNAAGSTWVRRELDLVLEAQPPSLLIVRLDDTEVPASVKDVLRVEAGGMSPADIAHTLAGIIQRRHQRQRIEEVRVRGTIAEAAVKEEEQARRVDYPPDASLTRGREHIRKAPLPPTGGTLPAPRRSAIIRCSFRVDVMCFLDTGTLVVGSGTPDDADVEGARAAGLLNGVQKVNGPTGMDGYFDQHKTSGRHLEHGNSEVRIVDARGDVVAQLDCRDGSVMSAAWSPDGDRVLAGSTNRLTIGSDSGRRIASISLFTPGTNYAPKSVAWQPSINPVYATGKTLVIADEECRTLRTLSDLSSDVIAVAVAPSGRYLAASARNGDIAIWSEWGELLTVLRGFGSDSWHARRCLAFSPDGRFLCQAACVGSAGFLVLEVESGRSVRVRETGTNLLAFHPVIPGLLATAAADRVHFWHLPAVSG